MVLEPGNFTPWVVMSPNFGTDNTLFTSKVCEGVFRTDGFNLIYSVTPGTFVDFIEGVVPSSSNAA